MKSILISIQPQWVEKILNGEKTIEIRKTMPKCELPCRVYIYCTKDVKRILAGTALVENSWLCWNRQEWSAQEKKDCGYGKYNGKVVAEFTLNKIEDFSKWEYDFGALVRHIDLWAGTRGDYPFLINYLKGQKKGYAWHIEDLVIYDKPKELSNFSHHIPNNRCPKKECGIDCEDCMSYDSEHETCLALYYSYRRIKRPPQSWCYVEELYEN